MQSETAFTITEQLHAIKPTAHLANLHLLAGPGSDGCIVRKKRSAGRRATCREPRAFRKSSIGPDRKDLEIAGGRCSLRALAARCLFRGSFAISCGQPSALV